MEDGRRGQEQGRAAGSRRVNEEKRRHMLGIETGAEARAEVSMYTKMAEGGGGRSAEAGRDGRSRQQGGH